MMTRRVLACWVFCLFQCCQPVSSNICNNESEYSKFSKCCSKCPPGSYTRIECTAEKDTDCSPCDSGRFQSEWNTLDHCQLHKTCSGEFLIEKHGTSTSDTICQCPSGKHCVNKDCEICEDNEVCKLGYGVVYKEGEEFMIPACEKCELGYFSNISSDLEPCRKWSDCGSLQMLEYGAATKDVKCGTPEPSSKVGLVTVIVLLSALLAIIILSFFINYGHNQDNRNKIRNAISRLLKKRIKVQTPIQELVMTENGRILTTAGDEDKSPEDGTQLLTV
ncbi:tumor necrosis factor receptor superfamily member 5-like isoform X2 [Heptranchias perlo]|uniref:tumor necrosis factor receptor superfamily member 5-like isoform X2 n=1 Tax=Heptranchias perlo TaxID=212740 RepID=UPI003559BB99